MLRFNNDNYNYTTKLLANKLRSGSAGFTIMEVVVSVTIFAGAITVMLTLFNYTFRIYRRVEAQRQVSQSVRSTMEFLAKEIRNGKIDYSIENGIVVPSISPCPQPSGIGQPTYSTSDTSVLGLINLEGERECIYWEHDPDPAKQDDPTNNNLLIQKETLGEPSQLNASNVKIKNLHFHIRPFRDPYVDSPSLVERQPFVTIVATVSVRLPTGEIRIVPYQTSISTYQYDIPSE